MTTTLTDRGLLDEELPASRYTDLLGRLSHQSVVKHFDAYADVDWDHPDNAIDPTDPRWVLPPDHPLGGTDWYGGLPAETRARIGLHWIAGNMQTGLRFENLLKRGLLEYAFRLPDGAPEFRYVYHEVIEEAQHSLMFQEFVNRTGMEMPGIPWDMRLASRQNAAVARRTPCLFFVFVLAGEDPIDHVQRTVLRSGRELHPLFERIMRIHVTEEARHLSFARAYLRAHVPRLPDRQRRAIALQVPFILARSAGQMMRPPRHLVRTYGIPGTAIRQGFGPGTASRQEVRDALRKLRKLLVELDLVTPTSKRLWRRFDIWDET
jgi:P-aminobenzoate N-oxygenase AurF